MSANDPVGPDAPVRVDGPGVVDEDVQPCLRGADPLHGVADRHERPEIRHDRREPVRAVRLAQLASQVVEAGLASADEDDPGAEIGERLRRGAAEARGRARDQDRAAFEGARRRIRPRIGAAADRGPEPAEAADDRELQNGIDKGCEWRREAGHAHTVSVGQTFDND